MLARILDEDGYIADFQSRPDGTYLIREHNCAAGTPADIRHAEMPVREAAQAVIPAAEFRPYRIICAPDCRSSPRLTAAPSGGSGTSSSQGL